jgi:hypothetical protein
VLDGLFSEQDIRTLHEIAVKGMSLRPNPGGPTILDINTGFLRDSNGMTNIYNKPHNLLFEPHEFETYKRIQLTLKDTIMREFGIEDLFFTAPTFITRLTGGDWEPAEIHDEYWSTHTPFVVLTSVRGSVLTSRLLLRPLGTCTWTRTTRLTMTTQACCTCLTSARTFRVGC